MSTSLRHRLLLIISAFMLLLSLGGRWLAPYEPDDILDMPFADISAQHWLGTDYLGADVLSRVLSGGQMLVLTGVVVVIIAWLLAGSLGMLAALYGGWRDKLALTLADLLQSIPGLLMVLLLVLLSGQQGYLVAALSSVLITSADIIRIARSATLQAMQHDYIDIARLRGESIGWMLFHELAPAMWSLITADAAIRFIGAVFMVASVSFLGLGAAPPQADWGMMIMENRDGLALQPLAVLAPVVALLLLLLPLTLLADNLASPVSIRRQRSRSSSVSVINPTVNGRPSAEQSCIATHHFAFNNFGLNVGDQRLLDNISLTLSPGTITALVGASGAGKTTLLHALAGELPIGSERITGSIWLCGEPILQLSARQCRRLRRRHIGYLPQDPRVALLPLQRTGSLLRRRAASLGVRGRAASLLIEQQLSAVALPADRDFLRRLPHQLSGGQRQRVLLALALMGNPALLLLDEPGSAQDSINTRALYQHVRRLASARNIAVLLVAHDIRIISDIADNFIVLEQGKIEEITPCHTFLTTAQSTTGHRLLQASRWQSAAAATNPLITAADTFGSNTFTVHNLNAHYQHSKVLHDISFSLAAGDCLNIVGASGCGKTTLLRCLLGLHTASSGTIHWKNQPLALPLASRDRHWRRRLQYVAQNPYDSLNPYHSVHQLLSRPLALFQPQLQPKQRQQQLCQALEQVGLDSGLQQQRVRQLSGGQRQRLALARALLVQPEILLCDEVTSAVDASNRQALIALLCRLRTEYQLTLIMVTHDLTLAAQSGGQILVMHTGKIVESGSVQQVMASPRHTVSQELLQCSAIISQGSILPK